MRPLFCETMANIRQEKVPGISSSFYSEDARRKLVSSLVQLEREKFKQEMDRNEREAIHSVEQLMLCPICNALSVEPITLPCGHTFCNFCIHNEFSSPFCAICQTSVGTDETRAVNFLLCNISAKCFPTQIPLHQIKTAAKKLILRKEYLEALNYLDTARQETMKLDANYHCLRGNCNFGLGNVTLALQDIEIAAKLSPFAVHILYWKARILMELRDNINALSVYIRLSALQPNNVNLQRDLKRSLNNLLHVDLSSLKEMMRKGLPTSVKNLGSLSELFFDKKLLDFSPSSSETSVVDNFKKVMSNEEQRSMESLWNPELHKSCKLDKVSQASLKICEDEFDCKLCCSLFFRPVTSPCGHTFCGECLRRSLDFRVDCPCCRTPLTKYLAERRSSVTFTIENIIKVLLPREYQTRKENFEKEMESMQSAGKSAEFEVPIFVCTLAFPSVPCPLHIFEPRYKLMIRRCVESGSMQFGMCAPSPNNNEPFATIGTMLKISHVAYLHDGRSLINTEGVRRFQVLSVELKDGYHLAKVKWLDDEKVVSDEEKSEIMKLHVNCYKLLDFWFSNLSSDQKECIVNAIGEIPVPEELESISSDQPHWLWWALAALPLMDKPKLIILSMPSVLERLRSMWRFLMIMVKMQGGNAAKQQ